MNKDDYLSILKIAVSQMHDCAVIWVKTEHVHGTFNGQTVWDGDVEVFNLFGHPKAVRAYAWAHLEGENNTTTRYVAVLEIPPVNDATTAVQAAILPMPTTDPPH